MINYSYTQKSYLALWQNCFGQSITQKFPSLKSKQNLLTHFGVQKESMTGIPIAKPLPIFSCWVSVVQLQAPETHVSFCISFHTGKSEETKDDEKEKLLKDLESTVQVLFNVNLKVKPGELLGVSGGVGSGKSSLISAIMGELTKLSGVSNVKGRLALVPQQAWIFSGTVRENILFGSKYNQKTEKSELRNLKTKEKVVES